MNLLPPDARLRKPRRALPPGTVDCHAHLFDRFERYPLAAGREDCWTKVSSWYRLSDSGAPQCEDMRPLVQAVLRERPDRCVWGSNWPHPGLTEFMPNDADLVDQLESWLPGDAAREPLFASNAAKLYRFSSTG